MVDRCFNINVFCIAPGRILEIRSVQCIAHLVQKLPDILLLGVTFRPFHFHFLWINILDVLPAGAKAGVTGISPVDLEDIAPRNIRLLIMLLEQPFDVHAVGITADLLHQRIHPVIVRAGEWAPAGVEIQFDKPGARRVSANLAAQLENKRVMHQLSQIHI